MTETALIVEVPEADAAVGRLRADLDETATLGVPAHVTILYPFVPSEALTDAMRTIAAGAHADVRPHLTVASRADVLADEDRLRAVEALLTERLPIACEARALSLFVEDDAGRYVRRESLPFARGPEP